MSNPYVGPRPFSAEHRDRFHGRKRAIGELRNLLIAERIVLLYSPSGAGKSSLINAGLIPVLQDRFDIWGPARVNAEAPQGRNRFIWSTLGSLERGGSPPDGDSTLAEYADKRRKRSDGRSPLIIFDQFEEVLRLDPADIEAKQEFFRQVGDLLANRWIWALFCVHEDFLAALDPYRRLVPTHWQNGYRIDLLTKESAKDAITLPLEGTGRSFAPTVADTLVENLATAKSNYIEPLQLQVVCHDLWEQAEKAGKKQIENIGNVTGALRRYYENAVQNAADGHEDEERTIREWFGRQLISPDGVRNLVRDGLREEQIGALGDSWLIRPETRAGVTWYELAHDRLVEPVQESNKAWTAAKLSDLQREARTWDDLKRPRERLLRGWRLWKAGHWAASSGHKLLAHEQDYLRESRRARMLRVAVASAVVVLCLVGAAAMMRSVARDRAVAASQMAVAVSRVVQDTPDLAVLSALEADALVNGGESRGEAWLAPAAWSTSLEAGRSALLSAAMHHPWYERTWLKAADFETIADCLWFGDGELYTASDGSGEASVLSRGGQGVFQGGRRVPRPKRCGPGKETWAQRLDLPRGWQVVDDGASPKFAGPGVGGKIRTITLPERPDRLAVDSRGVWVAWTTRWEKLIHLSKIDDMRREYKLSTGELEPYSVRFSPDGSLLVAGCRDTTVQLWSMPDDSTETDFGVPVAVLKGHTDTVFDLEFSADGSRLYSLGGDQRVIQWRPGKLRGRWAECSAFVPGQRVACASAADQKQLEVRGAGAAEGTPLPHAVKASLAALRDRVLILDESEAVSVMDLGRGTGPGARILGVITASGISRDGTVAVTGDKEFKPATVNLWRIGSDLSLTAERKAWPLPSGCIPASVAVSSEAGLAAGGDDCNRIRVWRYREDRAPKVFVTRNTPQQLAFSPRGDYLGSVDQLGWVQVWSTVTGAEVGSGLKFPVKARPLAIAFAEDREELQLLLGPSTQEVYRVPLDRNVLRGLVCGLLPAGAGFLGADVSRLPCREPVRP